MDGFQSPVPDSSLCPPPVPGSFPGGTGVPGKDTGADEPGTMLVSLTTDSGDLPLFAKTM